MGEDNDLIQWGFNTLVESYGAYHSGEKSGKTSRSLRGFAAQMPEMNSKPASRPAAPKSLFVSGLGGRGAASHEPKVQWGQQRNAARNHDSASARMDQSEHNRGERDQKVAERP